MIRTLRTPILGRNFGLLTHHSQFANRRSIRYQSTSTKKDDKATESSTSKTPEPPTTSVTDNVVKPPLMDRIKHEIQHYWDGTKLLGFEIKVSTKLLFKMLRGYELSRRERSQFDRTMRDLFRLLPFSAFIIIPFAELLLPVALKIFPNLLPSTYESKAEKDKKKKKLLETRSKTSKFLRQTFSESGVKLPKATSEDEKAEFIAFFRALNTLGETPTKEQVVKIARLFKNDSVLDNLSRPQLVAMCRYMNLRPFGSDQILRYQIRYRLLQIIKDDRAIDYEGVESLSKTELQSACISRGIKTTDVSPARLKDDLKIWLDLRLRQKIPSTLLILSSVYTYGEASKNLDNYYEALIQVLRSIPDQVYNVTKAEVATDDAKLKLNVLKEQEELIKEEKEQEHTETPVKDDIKLEDYEKDEPEKETQGQIAEGDHKKAIEPSTEEKTELDTNQKNSTETKAEKVEPVKETK